MLFAVIENNNLISDILFQKENLRRINRRIMGKRLYLVDEL